MEVESGRGSHAAETQMVAAGGNLAFAARPHHVTRAILVGAKELRCDGGVGKRGICAQTNNGQNPENRRAKAPTRGAEAFIGTSYLTPRDIPCRCQEPGESVTRDGDWGKPRAGIPQFRTTEFLQTITHKRRRKMPARVVRCEPAMKLPDECRLVQLKSESILQKRDNRGRPVVLDVRRQDEYDTDSNGHAEPGGRCEFRLRRNSFPRFVVGIQGGHIGCRRRSKLIECSTTICGWPGQAGLDFRRRKPGNPSL